MKKFINHNIFKNVLLMTVIGLVLGALRPFGMVDIPVYLSMSFWVLTCILGYGIYAPIIVLSVESLKRRLHRQWLRVAIGAFGASVIMTAVVPIITWLFFAYEVNFVDRFMELFPRTILVGTVITVVSLMRTHIDTQKAALTQTEEALNSALVVQQDDMDSASRQFMAQLPIEKQGDLLCLQMDDHYIKVYTEKGHHMLLMRFKDALLALKHYPGYQTHRSWWVAHQAISQVKREERRLTLTLTNGLQVPVSKTHIKAIKEAGFVAS
ncbi:LytTR family transcriptional regulator DNA-binding domain-containing protein [Agaribacter flavus]|uniref:LytTR family transcriptional regulator DNA-binding domain-containing protein n=1 Tax=Agaribacter flavus TaxID=1902781 RepID=A0ABV7FV05_9ALTE